METIIVISCISAITYWSYNIAKLIDAREELED